MSYRDYSDAVTVSRGTYEDYVRLRERSRYYTIIVIVVAIVAFAAGFLIGKLV